MRTLTLIAAGAIVFVSLGSATVRAEEFSVPGKLGDYGKRYDLAAEETFTAKVLRVHVVSSGSTGSGCLAAEVTRDEDGRVDVVYLGPRSQWKKIDLDLREDQLLCFTGSRVELEGRSILIAKHVNDDQYFLRLRSEEGRHSIARLQRLPDETAFACAIASLSPRM